MYGSPLEALVCPAMHPASNVSPLTFGPTFGQEQHSEATVGFELLVGLLVSADGDTILRWFNPAP